MCQFLRESSFSKLCTTQKETNNQFTYLLPVGCLDASGRKRSQDWCTLVHFVLSHPVKKHSFSSLVCFLSFFRTLAVNSVSDFFSTRQSAMRQYPRLTFSMKTDKSNDTIPYSHFPRGQIQRANNTLLQTPTFKTNWLRTIVQSPRLTFSIVFLQKSVQNDGYLTQECVCANAVGTQHSQFQLRVRSHQSEQTKDTSHFSAVPICTEQ